MFGLFKSVYKHAWDGNDAEVMKRVQKNPELLKQYEKKTESSLLDISVSKLNVSLTKWLLDAGADPDFGPFTQGKRISPLQDTANHYFLKLFGLAS